MKNDVIIIDSRASGLMCAIETGRSGRSVLVLDHAEKIGKKVRISGGAQQRNKIGESQLLDYRVPGSDSLAKYAAAFLRCHTPSSPQPTHASPA